MYNLKPFIHRFRSFSFDTICLTCLFVLLSAIASPALAEGNPALNKEVDMQAIFFLDKYAINKTLDMKHTLFQTERVDAAITVDDGKTKPITYFNAFYDQSTKVYKAWYKVGKSDEMRMAHSTGGIKWQTASANGEKVKPENNIFYNPFTERWQSFICPSTAYGCLAMIESKDRKTWSDPLAVFHPSPQDRLGTEFCSMPVFGYEDILLGLLWKLRTGSSVSEAQLNGEVIEPELAYSYNGVFWNRTFKNFIDRSQNGQYLGSRICPDSLLTDHEGNIRIYSRAFRGDYGETGVILHKMRKDGFAGMESIGRHGYLQTKVFILKGDDLTLNVKAPFGYVMVQISDKHGQPYPGFSFDDAVEFVGDDVALRPQWKNKKSISELVGKEVRFEIEMRESNLYAIRVPVNFAPVKPSLEER